MVKDVSESLLVDLIASLEAHLLDLVLNVYYFSDQNTQCGHVLFGAFA